MHVMLSIAGSWAESSSRNNVNIFPCGADHLEVYQFDDHNPPGPGGKDHWPYGPLWVWHVSPPKSLPMPVKTNEDRKTGSYCNEGLFVRPPAHGPQIGHPEPHVAAINPDLTCRTIQSS